MRILIAAGAGFWASHLGDLLVSQGHQVARMARQIEAVYEDVLRARGADGCSGPADSL